MLFDRRLLSGLGGSLGGSSRGADKDPEEKQTAGDEAIEEGAARRRSVASDMQEGTGMSREERRSRRASSRRVTVSSDGTPEPEQQQGLRSTEMPANECVAIACTIDVAIPSRELFCWVRVRALSDFAFAASGIVAVRHRAPPAPQAVDG